MHTKEAEKKVLFNRLLQQWFKKNRRDFKWRRTNDPYKILVLEIMLQQTGTGRVIPKYSEFIQKFPIAKKLANASLGTVLRAWSGLGYNRRAKYLWQAARMIQEKYRGVFPREIHELRELPGVGLATAAAIRSFAFGYDEPMIDTNIRRILTRVFFSDKRPASAKASAGRQVTDSTSSPQASDKVLHEFAKKLIPRGKGRAWNYAMLDVGAIVCKAVSHNPGCPFAKLHGSVGRFSYKKPQSKFARSQRFYRGQFLKFIAEAPGGIVREDLRFRLKINKRKFGRIAHDLKSEALISERGARLLLPRGNK